ncbi:serine hydrolase [Alicycliphilus sp. T452]
MHARFGIASRLSHALALLTVGVALASPGVHAAERKHAAAKKHSTAVAAKRAAPKHAAKVQHKTASAKATRVSARSAKTPVRMAAEPARLSFGQLAGLHEVSDPLDLKSSVALVIDQDTKEVLLSKNDHAVLPIASLTKLMTGLLISEARLPMDEPITITQDDVDTEKGSGSRLTVGTTLSRGELLHLALMSSENRAAHALGRTYPGGLEVFVQRMNAKARLLGMTETRYVEPTGLSSKNQSSAHDLATLVNVAHGDPLLRELSTSPSHEVAVGQRVLQYNNTNRLVKSPAWDIGLQKTGYISEAGRCLVMQAQVAGRKLIMVFLDSAGKFSRLGDAERVRSWVEKGHPGNSASLHLGATAPNS